MYENDETANWDEFEWERGLKESDEYAARYFELLKRFCDLPGGNELIAQQLERDFRDKLPDCDFDCESCDDRWDCEFTNVQDWETDEEDEPEEGEEGPFEEEDGEDDEPEAGDPLFYESDATFNILRQSAIGWCNVYAAVLPPETRTAGLKILFLIGRALANLAYSIGDGVYEQPAASIAFAKRSLAQLNTAIGLLAKMVEEKPLLGKLLTVIQGNLLQSREAVVDHLQQCRSRLASAEE